MTHQPKVRRPSALLTAGFVVGLALVPVHGALAWDRTSSVVSPDENVFGMTYGDWSAAWWQYILSIPTDTNPVLDTTGAHCSTGQSSGPVFFLAGAATTDLVTRSCTVPAGKALVFPIISAECSTVESAPFFGKNGHEMRTCAAAFGDGVGVDTLKLVVDGTRVRIPRDLRAQSPQFRFGMPAQNNFLGLPGVTSGSSLSDGFWVILRPLAPGNHVIHFEGAFASGPGAGFSQNVTYHLSVTE